MKNKEKKPLTTLGQTIKEMKILSNAIVEIANRVSIVEDAMHHLLSLLNKNLEVLNKNGTE